jgi:nucleoside-diphosphate-sugar epimerase
MTILNSNLVFGKQAYLLHFMAQSAAAGKLNKSIGGSRNFQYKPVGSDDLSNAVTTALTQFDSVKGKRFTVNGAQSLSLSDILHLIEKSVGRQEGNTSLSTSLGISDFFEEFFVGIAQDKNMARFAEFMDAHNPNLEEGSPDFHSHFNVGH